MILTDEQVTEALRVVDLSDPDLFAEACASFESAGIEVPLFSSDPLSRLVRYLREELLPRVRSKQAEFDHWVSERSVAIQSEIAKHVDSALTGIRVARGAVAEYVGRMQAEGLAGPETARMVILLATADALKKVVAGNVTDPFAALSYSDWLMIALSYLRLRADLIGGPPTVRPQAE